jgi:hypothetical protein
MVLACAWTICPCLGRHTHFGSRSLTTFHPPLTVNSVPTTLSTPAYLPSRRLPLLSMATSPLDGYLPLLMPTSPLDACLPPLSTATSPLDGYLPLSKPTSPLDVFLPSRRLPPPPRGTQRRHGSPRHKPPTQPLPIALTAPGGEGEGGGRREKRERAAG